MGCKGVFITRTCFHDGTCFPDPNYWDELAEAYIHRRLEIKENTNIAKNVILFIGDGLGPTTVTASRILRGQINGRPGEETILKFEEFPHIALSKVKTAL